VADWIAAIILGLVEGLTEFIPVSSTGHLLLAKEALGLPNTPWDTFIVMIQLGAILAVVAVYFARLWKVLLGLPGGFGLLRPGVGFVLARVAADEAEILTLAVVPAARRQGHGEALLAGAMAAAVARGAGAMFLEVSEQNEAARALYAAAGFAEAGRRRGYYPDGSDALVLKRGLLGPTDSDLRG
jgi:ribosomal-protein-alanine N-acetyltransferase